jgi:hypothetical protein
MAWSAVAGVSSCAMAQVAARDTKSAMGVRARELGGMEGV